MRSLLLITAFLATAWSGVGAQTVVIGNDFTSRPLGKNIQFLSTAKNAVTIDQLTGNQDTFHFKPYDNDLLIFHEDEYEEDLWVNFTLINSSSFHQSLVVDLNNSLINNIEFFEIAGNKKVKSFKTGDALTPASRALQYRCFAFPVEIAAGDTRQYFIKFNLDGRKVHVPILLYKQTGFIEQVAGKELGLGIFYGLLIMITVLFFYMSYLMRDRAFFAFALYMLAHTLLQISISGASNIYIWGNYPHLADRCIAFFMSVSMVLGLQFVIEFIVKDKFGKWPLSLIRSFQLVSFFIVVCSLSGITLYNAGIWLMYRLIPLFYFLMFFVAALFFIRKYLPARVFIIGYIGAIISIAGILYFTFLKKHGNVFTNNIVITGEIIKCGVLSLALLDRLKIFKEEKETAQAKVISQLEELNTYKEQINMELETKVAEKSRELIMKQNEVKKALISGEEKERKRVARELLDGMGSLLSTLRLNAESIDLSNKGLEEKEALAYRNVLEMIDKACTELRAISHNMLPPGIEMFGLNATLQSLIRKLNNANSTIFELDTMHIEGSVNRDTELHVYRIVLELINNIVKHANAERATVQLIGDHETLSVIVEDNGKGFDSQNHSSEGVGLISIRSRVEALGGKIFIDSIPRHGTTVLIEIPMIPVS